MHEHSLYGSGAAAKAVGISLRQLYYWVNVLQVVAPQVHPHGGRMFRRFTAGELRQLQWMKGLVGRGYTVRAAGRMVKQGSHGS